MRIDFEEEVNSLILGYFSQKNTLSSNTLAFYMKKIIWKVGVIFFNYHIIANEYAVQLMTTKLLLVISLKKDQLEDHQTLSPKSVTETLLYTVNFP